MQPWKQYLIVTPSLIGNKAGEEEGEEDGEGEEGEHIMITSLFLIPVVSVLLKSNQEEKHNQKSLILG